MAELVDYFCCGTTVRIPAEWDQSAARCPFCVELLVKPVIPDLGSDEDRRQAAVQSAFDKLKEQFAASAEPLVRTCLNCGQPMQDQKCKLVCSCGYYASCSDFL